MAKYTNAKYPDKINDLIDNDGNINEEALGPAVANKADLVDGKVPAEQLPSYVDDVIEFPSLSNFPAEGESGLIYVALDSGFTYRWGESAYVQIGGQDLSQYSTTAEVEGMIEAAITDALEATY